MAPLQSQRFISAEREKLLSMTNENIFDITTHSAGDLSFLTLLVHTIVTIPYIFRQMTIYMLSSKIVKQSLPNRLRKSSWGSSNSTHATSPFFPTWKRNIPTQHYR
ncbi:hypothetical protein H5410_026088 [Solanum commersonii]|uniref:Uncharacterized protein n=1 Tax=Solanum commersonii TaxID=4109 RepID=A0A9J5YZU0_SOLCO|nr:hypothetical protein H5410_026088 [Solanum commersonii]